MIRIEPPMIVVNAPVRRPSVLHIFKV